LPIRKESKVLVVGENAIKMMTVGGGSSSLKVQREVLPLDGLTTQFSIFNPQSLIDYVRGYVGDTVQSYNGVTVGRSIAERRSNAELRAEAVEKAKQADVVIVFGGLNKADYQDCEGHDRQQYELPYEQNELVEALAQVNKNIVFVNISGNAVAMPWIDKVPAIVQGWFIGSEAGNALADVLTGRVNPSGKLPFTWYRQLSDVGAHSLGTYPGTWRPAHDIIDEEYKEDIFVGYRWADKKKVKPLFPFGYGLSYTTFKLGKLTPVSLDEGKGERSFSIDITNTGSVAGAETVQLYISDLKSSVDRPLKELKAFKKVWLQPGETKTVTLTIDRRALSFWNPQTNEWTVEPGTFEALVGTSAGNIIGKVRFSVD
jgi:beta-glucosidase